MLAGVLSLVLLTAKSSLRSEPYRWKPVQIVAGGFVSGILFHPKQKGLAYLRTDIGGAYRWRDQSKSWVPLQDFLTKPDWNLYGIESIGLDPSDPNRLILACGTYTNDWAGNGAILFSNDQGRTFKRLDVPFKLGGNEDGRSIGERLAVDPNDPKSVYLGTRHNGLWVTHDAFKTFTQIRNTPPDWTSDQQLKGTGLGIVLIDPEEKKSTSIYVGVANRDSSIWHSPDGGKSWVPLGAPKGLLPHHMQLTTNGDLIATFGNGPGPNGISAGAVWKYKIQTSTWTDITPKSGSETIQFGFAGLAVETKAPSHVIVSTLDRWSVGDDLFETFDGGRHWRGLKSRSARNSSAAPYMKWGKSEASFGWWIGALAMDPFRSSHLLYGTGANLWSTQDADNQRQIHWQIAGNGIEETAVIDLLSPLSGPHLISGLGDIGGFTHEQLDQSPSEGMTLNPILGNVDCLDQSDQITVRVGRGNDGHGGYSKDHGKTWVKFPNEPPKAEGGSVSVMANSRSILWSPSGQSPSYTSDFGQTWFPVRGLEGSVRVFADRKNSQKAYAIDERGGFFRSTDGGKNFARMLSSLPARTGKPSAPFDRGNDIWIPSESGLFRSNDGGESFMKVSSVDSAEGIGFGMPRRKGDFPAIYLNGKVQGEFGVFRSEDQGHRWLKISDPQHEYGTRGVVTGDPKLFGRVYLGTNGRGILYGDPILR